MADTARIDDLRRRLAKDPGSLVFATLAEELRRAGNLEEAVSLCRGGLEKHSGYLSAHMTLGRALADGAQHEAAQAAFEKVLGLAPDNLLASRLLSESYEHTGRLAEAKACLERAVRFAGADGGILARIAELDGRIGRAVVPEAPPAIEPVDAQQIPEPTESPAPTPDLDIPDLAALSDERVEESPPPAPIPLAAADESFELERAYEAAGTQWQAQTVDDTVASGARGDDEPVGLVRSVEVVPGPSADELISADLLGAEAESEEEEGAPTVQFPTGSLSFDTGSIPAITGPVSQPVPVADELASPTLGEIYLRQGAVPEAESVFRRVLDRDPGNERAKAGLEVSASMPPTDAVGSKQRAVARAIERLEAFRSAASRRKG